MQEVLLITGAAAALALGWFLMRRLDAFLERRRNTWQKNADGAALRIGLSDPLTAACVLKAVESLGPGGASEAYLYTADSPQLCLSMSAGGLDMIFVSPDTETDGAPALKSAPVSLERGPMSPREYGLPVEPLYPGPSRQKMAWDARGSAAAELAGIIAGIHADAGNCLQNSLS